MTVEILITILVFAAIVWYLGFPLLSTSRILPPDISERNRHSLQIRKSEVLSSLKELELEHQMKKISDEDFEELFQESFEEGKRVLEEMDSIPKGEQTISRYCHQCGAELIIQANFCSQCGTKIIL